ncbi:hypothetical protein [Shewanella marina]|uniref:hypothetical protein n=1 Tax=Shewanella marina TaxID=487319 RepID=UPI000472B249|nr:hypothetical protein [Shewanella marina]
MRLSWFSASLILLSTSTHAASPINSLQDCRQINDKLERLVCYDNLADAQQVNPQAQATIVATPPAVVASKPENTFGVIPKPIEKVDKIELTISKVNKNPYGALRLYFENGQVWKQTDTRSFRLKSGDKVYIERAALGSFLLGIDGRNTTIRVKRVE